MYPDINKAPVNGGQWWGNLKAGNPEGEKREIKKAHTEFPVAQIKKTVEIM